LRSAQKARIRPHVETGQAPDPKLGQPRIVSSFKQKRIGDLLAAATAKAFARRVTREAADQLRNNAISDPLR
jgi:hypothetical protein